MITKILCYSILTGKQIIITLFLSCFAAQVVASQRSSEKEAVLKVSERSKESVREIPFQ